MAHKKNLIENAFTHSFILELLLEYKYFSHKTRNWLHCSYEVACKKLIEKYGTSNREGIIYYIRENEQEIAEDVYRSLGRSFDTDIYKPGICPLFDGFILETLNSGRNATKKLRTALGIKRQPDLYTYFKERYDAYSVDEVISTIINRKSVKQSLSHLKTQINEENLILFLANADNLDTDCKSYYGVGISIINSFIESNYNKATNVHELCDFLGIKRTKKRESKIQASFTDAKLYDFLTSSSRLSVDCKDVLGISYNTLKYQCLSKYGTSDLKKVKYKVKAKLSNYGVDKSHIDDQSILDFLMRTKSWKKDCKEEFGISEKTLWTYCKRQYGTGSMKEVKRILRLELA